MMDKKVSGDAFFWALQGVCALHRKPFSDALARQQLAAPYTTRSLLDAMQAYGFDAVHHKAKAGKLDKESFPLIAWLQPKAADPAPVQAAGEEQKDPGTEEAKAPEQTAPALVLQADATKLLLIEAGDASPRTLELAEFALRYNGHITRVTPQADPAADPDSEAQARQSRKFGFSWFVPELLKHKRLWQEVLLASLVIQLIALATPLFTQAIIDKVVVHRTESTLIVIAIGMLVFMTFSAALSWLRQYLVLHTGNRVDAVLGSSVFERLFKLPPLYFQHRPTGVIAARLHGVETIREFIASAAVTLVLDFPFLLIFVAIMFYYSVTLTLIVLAILAVIVGLSLVVAPLFQARLQEQFQMGARNQAFLTEYVVG
ncbi:ABC transporter transmembrane domain-containing protein, partial [Polaromonas sp. CT11-55]|uniref:ABC transporter transmembrane domain-containing protein n=1 Tax=Polaromonas sp. CT11-55 TaxID=3243045 RepID=UPI0039A68A22